MQFAMQLDLFDGQLCVPILNKMFSHLLLSFLSVDVD